MYLSYVTSSFKLLIRLKLDHVTFYA